MSLSVGVLGLMSLRKHFRELLGIIFGKGEIRSMFYAVVFLVVCLVLAYLTNPSENSFRAYLTEQSFRQHLSRLDDATDDDPSSPDDTRYRYNSSSSTRTPVSPYHTRNVETFHFANRASVSLRTPKHAFHSFGIFTVAAMLPLPKSDNTYRYGSIISDSWFIGAFGKWWRGGILEAWYQDVVARSKDEESWTSGILGIKTLDKLNEYNGLPFSTKSLPLRSPTRGSPPRLRNRERLSHRPGVLPTRSSTPPPLPKSASLPLHTRPPPKPDHRHSQSAPILSSHSLPTASSEQVHLGSPAPSKSPSALFDQSPLIVEVLHQISLSKSTVHDLRESLTSFQAAATESHALLQGEVDSYRERKRQEDLSRLDLKNRTKTLEETKRHAEGAKRDAEKRLKAARGARDSANLRMERLNKEIASLQQRHATDEEISRKMREEALKEVQDINEVLEQKKQEIKVAEDVVSALNARAKELEDKISSERKRLRVAKERAEIRKQDLSFLRKHAGNSESTVTTTAWSPPSFIASYDANSASRSNAPTFSVQEGYTPGFKDSPTSPRPANLSLGAMSNFSPSPKADESSRVALRSKGYSIFDDDIASLDRYMHSTTFAPFGEPSPLSRSTMAPAGTSSGLMNSLNLAANPIQSDNDNWRGMRVIQFRPGENLDPLTASPISMHGSSSSGNNDYDPFEVRVPTHDRLNSEPSLDSERFSLPHRTHSNSMSHTHEESSSSNFVVDKSTGPRRWFSTSSKEKPKKGLNPDAKVFRLSKKAASIPPTDTYDALNPNGVGSSTLSSTSTSNSLLRAFAPSPAEREVLQRALGGSTNASLERLPSLSDVGSIPPSPAHVHAPVAHAQSAREMGKVLPWWLQSLPRMRKSNFSPWDDEEPVANGQR